MGNISHETVNFSEYIYLSEMNKLINQHNLVHSVSVSNIKIASKIDQDVIFKDKSKLSHIMVADYSKKNRFDEHVYLNSAEKYLIKFMRPVGYSKAMSCELEVYADSEEKAQSVSQDILSKLDPFIYTSEEVDGKVEFNMWYFNNGKAVPNTQKLACPTWDEIKSNYNADIGEALTDIHTMIDVDKRGKIILWHGIPGTGKTHVVRSLSRAFTKRWSINLITDPEMFMADPSYMISLTNNYSSYEYDIDEDDNQKHGALFIFEDAPSFVLKSAREYNSNGMSRLLNMTDGIMGQGLNIIMLLTTNHPKVDIDDAFLRPGRLIQEIEFRALSYNESVEWLKKNDFTNPIEKKEHTLAELYAIKAGTIKIAPSIVKSQAKMGF